MNMKSSYPGGREKQTLATGTIHGPACGIAADITIPMPGPAPQEGTVTATLSERGERYGAFVGHAEVTQRLKATIIDGLTARGKVLAPDQQEALDMICHKIGRIVNGDPNYADSWHDIAGYATLVDKRLQGQVL